MSYHIFLVFAGFDFISLHLELLDNIFKILYIEYNLQNELNSSNSERKENYRMKLKTRYRSFCHFLNNNEKI